jgi:zinc transporter ZupT
VTITLHAGFDAQLIFIGILAGLATLLGGALALNLRDRLPILAAFGSGAVICVALAELLPEALALGRGLYPPIIVTAVTIGGFMAYLMIDALRRRMADQSLGQGVAKHLAPASLVAHSVMDGLGIGIAFHVSVTAGAVVALAVLAHDLLDGANTVTLSFAGNMSPAVARRWLVLDAAAPLAGIALSRAVAASPGTLALLLAGFAGLLLFIGAGELLPRSRVSSSLLNTCSTVLGAALVLAIVLVGPA